MYARGYYALLSAHDRVQDDTLSFTDVFAPELKVMDWLGTFSFQSSLLALE